MPKIPNQTSVTLASRIRRTLRLIPYYVFATVAGLCIGLPLRWYLIRREVADPAVVNADLLSTSGYPFVFAVGLLFAWGAYVHVTSRPMLARESSKRDKWRAAHKTAVIVIMAIFASGFPPVIWWHALGEPPTSWEIQSHLPESGVMIMNGRPIVSRDSEPYGMKAKGNVRIEIDRCQQNDSVSHIFKNVRTKPRQLWPVTTNDDFRVNVSADLTSGHFSGSQTFSSCFSPMLIVVQFYKDKPRVVILGQKDDHTGKRVVLRFSDEWSPR